MTGQDGNGNHDAAPARRDRFHRLRRVTETGPDALATLREHSAVIVGCGALGSAAASLLVRSGLGRLRLVDRDVVEWGNLGDQCLYLEEDASNGRLKAEVAAERLLAFDADVRIEASVADLAADNVRDLVEGFDVIIDGSDNLETKYLLNDAAVAAGMPWVYAGCAGSIGSVLAVVPGRTHCLRCIWPRPPAAYLVEGCESAGLLPTTVTMVAAAQVTEALKVLLAKEDELVGQVMTIDTWAARMRRIPFRQFDERRNDCPTCGRGEFSFLDARVTQRTETLCGGDTVLIRGGAWFDYERARARLEADLRASTPSFFSLDTDGCRLVVFRSGRALVHGTCDPVRARALFGRYIVP
jgi:molybdopterin-synthase adenylyltransferase